MASGLSSNWKKLQVQLQQGVDKSQGTKRKAGEDDITTTTSSSSLKPHSKKAKVSAIHPQAAKASRKVSSSKKTTTPTSNTKSKMGAVQSQPSKHMTTSPAIWKHDTGTTTTLEEISEAYSLGLNDATTFLHSSPARPNEGLSPQQATPGKYIAIDCEMVGVGEGGYAHALARVSIVDFHGRQVYDSYVRPREKVIDWRTKISGIAPKHMAVARDLDDVRATVADLLRGRVLVGHDIKHDLDVLMLEHPHKMVRDTARFGPFRKYGHGPKPALKVLAREILGVEIQSGQHSSLEDAKAAMLLFRKYKPAFDVDIANRYPEPTPTSTQSKAKAKAKRTKKKRRN